MTASRRQWNVVTLRRVLVRHRLWVYGGCLGLIVVTRAVTDESGGGGVGLGQQAVVVGALGVIVLTYLAERATRSPDRSGDGSGRAIPAERRVHLLVGMGGISVGIYLTVAANSGIGLLFLLGALLFVHVAVRGTAPADRDDQRRGNP